MNWVKIALKDLRSIAREKTFILSFMLILFISSFINIISAGLAVLYGSGYYGKVKIGLVGDAPVFESLANPIKFEDIQTGLKFLSEGKIDALLVFNENITGRNNIRLYLPKEEIRAVKSIPYLRKVLMEYQDKLRLINGYPVLNIRVYDKHGSALKIPEGLSLQFKFIYVVIIPMLAILSAIISSMYLIDIICEEFETRSIEVLSTVARLDEVISGKFLPSFIIFLILTCSWIVVVNANNVYVDFLLTLYSSLSLYILMASISLIVSIYVKNREKSQLLFSLIIIPLIILFLIFENSPIHVIVLSAISVLNFACFVYLAFSGVFLALSMISSTKILEKTFLT